MNINAIRLALGACVLAAGCSVLSPQPDRSRFFILTPISDSAGTGAQAASTSAGSQVVVGVGPVDFPDYLRRLPVVKRVAPNRVDLSDEERWAEPLDKNFVRVLSENLATLLNTSRIERFPWPVKDRIDYQVEVNVERFETTSDGQAQLSASWIIRDGPSDKILYASRTATGAPAGPDELSASAALSSDLVTLSKAIALHIIDHDLHPTPGSSEANFRLGLAAGGSFRNR
jgi:uncharacterized lipoprotein YmbA